MHGHRITHIDDPGPLRVSPLLKLVLLIVAGIGLFITLAGLYIGSEKSRQDTWSGLFVSSIFFWYIAMGASAFLAIQYIAKAKWFYPMKRLPEALASFTYKGGSFLMLLVVCVGVGYLYPWAPSAHYADIWPNAAPSDLDPTTLKFWWLSPTVHYVKMLVYIGLPTAVCFMLIRASQEPTEYNQEVVAMKRLRISIIYMLVFATLFSLFAWEGVLSVDPKWFSTMFGVYAFAGAFVSAIAVMMLMLLFILRPRVSIFPERQAYDLGTYVMAFATFMVYIGFSQFMLIWYANMYEETFFYLNRFEGGWAAVTIALPMLKWVIPFFVLMPPPFRTSRIAQGLCCVSILVGELLDIIWVVIPVYHPEGVVMPSIYNICSFIGVGAFFCWSTISYLSNNSLLPVRDAELVPSVNGDYLHA